jgi:hypothetical protein
MMRQPQSGLVQCLLHAPRVCSNMCPLHMLCEPIICLHTLIFEQQYR